MSDKFMEKKLDRIPDLDGLLRLQFDQPSKKREVAYGLRIAKEMWSYISYGNENYYQNRYTNWVENRMWAKGSMDGSRFLPMMGIEGNKAWINIDPKILKIVPSYVNKIVQILMDREEKPSVKATDIGSVKAKEREKIMARYRMENQQKIKEMESMSGLKLEDEFTPEDEDELDIYYKIEYRLPEEAFFEDQIQKVLDNSDIEYLKRELLRDCVITNLMATKKELVSSRYEPQQSTLSNRVRIRRCDPMNTVYNIFKMANGSDVSIIGEAYALKISDARRKYPKVSEKDWFTLAQYSQKGLTQARPLDWIDSYLYDFNRPYDDYSFFVFDFEVKVHDKEYYVKGDFGVHAKKGKPAEGPNKEIIDVGKFNMYCGVFAVNTDIMLHWDIAYNQIRPYQNGVDVFSNYSIVYPHADGFYVPSLLERGIPCVRQMILCALKIQQMVSLMEPDNMSVDISGLQDGLDLGTGSILKPMQLLKLKKQTGWAFWDSTDTSGTGNEGGKNPYQQVSYGGNAAQINILVSLYNFWLQRLNDEWGVTPEVMGQPTAAKKSVGATKQATMAGNLAFEYIYDHFVMILEQNATKIAYTLWDYIVLESSSYKEMGGINRELIDTTFDVNIDMIDKSTQKGQLLEMVQEALNSKLIGMATAARLQNIPNPKDAILYLEKMEKRNKKEVAQNQQRQMQMNAQVQQQSTQIATEGKIRETMASAQAKAAVEVVKGNDVAYKELVSMIKEVEKDSIKNGVELPEDIKALRDALIGQILQTKAQQSQPQQEQPREQQMQ